MAQITEADQAKLRAQGQYAKERCDRPGCNHIITWCTWKGAGGKRYCSRDCRDNIDGNPIKLKKHKEEPAAEAEVNPVAKRQPPKHVSADRFMGIATVGTMLEKMLKALLDGKWHKKDSFKGMKVRENDSVGWHLTLLERGGAKAERPFKLENDGDKYRVVFLQTEHTGGGHEKEKGVKV